MLLECGQMFVGPRMAKTGLLVMVTGLLHAGLLTQPLEFVVVSVSVKVPEAPASTEMVAVPIPLVIVPFPEMLQL